MITSATYKKTIDGEHCQKLAADMKNDTPAFMRKNKLHLEGYRTLETCLYELWHKAETKTFQSDVAEVFRKYGFNVALDEHGINYHIA
jgi:hypothetical protein